MRTRNPDRRYRAVKAAAGPLDHEFEVGLWHVLRGNPDGHENVAYAYELFTTRAKDIVQAWIVARAEDQEISKWTTIPVPVLKVYRHLFFDIHAFRDELDIICWIQEYEFIGTPDAVQMLQMAITNGPEVMAWMYGRGRATMDPQRVQEQLMTDAYHRGRSHRGLPISSKEAQAAHAFMGTAIKVAQVLGKTHAPDVTQLLIKLQHRDRSIPIEEAVQQGEVLH